MPRAIRCLILALFCSAAARVQSVQGITGSVIDVGPEAGPSGSTAYPSFLFRGPDEILVVSGRTGIFKGIDRGQSWVRSERGLVEPNGVEPYVQGLCHSASAPQIAYASTFDGHVSRSADFGDTWEPPTPLPNDGWSCAVDPSDASVVYVLSQLADQFYPTRLHKSTDGGRSFAAVGAGLPGDGEYSFALAVAPTNPLTVYVGLSVHSGGVFVSSDGGLNFRALPNSPPLPDLVYAHPTEDGTLLVWTDSGLFLSTDAGESFEKIGANLPGPSSLAFDYVDPAVVYAAGGPDGLFRSLDGGRTFARIDSLEEEQLIGVGVTSVALSPREPADPPVVYAGTSLGPIRSDDGGQTFAPIHEGYRGLSVNDLALDAAGRLLLATWNSAGVFRATQPGVYETIGDTLPRAIAVSLNAIAASPDDPDLYIVGGRGPSAIFRTTDGGVPGTKRFSPAIPAFTLACALRSHPATHAGCMRSPMSRPLACSVRMMPASRSSGSQSKRLPRWRWIPPIRTLFT